jgi:hypothetical protein
MVGFLYSLLALIIGLLNAGSLIMDGHKYGYSFVQGMIAAAIVRFLIVLFLEK